MTTPTAPKPTVHDLCLEFARNATGVERYLLLRLALMAERTTLVELLKTEAMTAAVPMALGVVGSVINKMMAVVPAPVTPPPAN